MQSEIKFGTDGWRGIIAKDFTFKNVEKVAHAIGKYMSSMKGKKVAIGYDTRFMSHHYAYLIAEVLSSYNINVYISDSIVPTPMLSFFVKDQDADGGIMITASHNPHIYNGVKFKEPCGASSFSDTTKKIEKLLSNEMESFMVNPQLIRKINMSKIYINAVKQYLSLDDYKDKKLTVVVDSMYGAGMNWISKILEGNGHKVISINAEHNPSFPNVNPEPIEQHLGRLKQMVIENNADLGIATDGDADRVGIVSSNGRYLTPHYVFSLLLIHLLEDKKMIGKKVVRSTSSTFLVDRICDNYQIPCEVTKVGFKYIAKIMLEEDVLIGGEESGGNGFKNHIPERDGILSGLLIAEMILHRNKTLAEIISDMEKQYGRSYYKRIDMHLKRQKIDKLKDHLLNEIIYEINGNKIEKFETFDGCKYTFGDQSWLLIRPSGTEPLLRLYSEAGSEEKVDKLLDYAQTLIKSI